MYVQRARRIGRQAALWATEKAEQELVDAVPRDRGRVGCDRSAWHLGVCTVNASLVRLAASPERQRRRRRQEREALQVGRCRLQGADQRRVAITKPGEERGVGWPLADEFLERVEVVVARARDVSGGPAVNHADVAQEAANAPPRTCWQLSVERGALSRRREQVALGT